MKDIKVEVGADGDDSRPLCSHCGKELTHVDDHRSHLNLIYNLHVCCVRTAAKYSVSARSSAQ
jgi:hypothetical protein